MTTRTIGQKRHRKHAWLCAALAALVLVYSLASAAKKEEPPVDIASIAPGHGIVMGSVLVTWPKMPAMAKMNLKEKIIEIQRLEATEKHKVLSEQPVRLRADLDKEKFFLLDLKASGYLITCLYLEDLMLRQPTGYCYPIAARFDVVEGKVTYLGRVSLVMPSKLMSLQLVVTIEDRRQEAIDALTARYGAGVADATTALAHAPARPDRLGFSPTPFPRLAENFNRNGMVNFQEEPGRYTLTRFVAQGRNKDDWDIAFEVMDSPRMFEPPTVAEWLTRFRTQSDQNCPGGEWEILAQTDNDVTFERRTGACPPHVAQHAMYRVLYGPQNVFTLICTQKGVFDALTRAECRATLQTAEIATP
jgi:hypothetical protein